LGYFFQFKGNVLISTKYGLGCIFGDFFKNSSGHPASSRHAPVLKNLISILITCRSDEEWFLGADTELNKKLFNVFFSNDS
jgi:hypothetical protein